MSAKSALTLKEAGNRCFQNGDFAGAESFYSNALIVDPTNAALYTNRALARIKLALWDDAISDCQTCLSLASDNMKAHYYLSQAQHATADFDAALKNALAAHTLCVKTGDKSMAAVTALVLKCKKDRWEHREAMRVRETAYLEQSLLDLLALDRHEMLADGMHGELETREIEEECDAKMARVKQVFEAARTESEKKREVPDWAIDDISFGIMVDPVITKTGKSYERASILEHLRRHPSDPLTREPLLASELRPNLALKQACEEFLEQNGWAVDW